MVLVPAAALAFSLRTPKTYTATATLLFRDPGFDQKLFGSSVQPPSQDPNREAATNLKLVSLPRITALASTTLDRTPSELRDKVKVTPQGQADVLAVMASDSSPVFAARIANTVASQYILFRKHADRSKINESLDLVRSQFRALDPQAKAGEEGRSLKSRGDQLAILASLQTGNAELVQPASPPQSASSPKPLRNTLIGTILGLILGLGVAALRERLDRKLRDHADVEAILERPILAVVPESRLLKAGGRALLLSGPEHDAFSMLRTNLRYFAVDQQIRSMLITSSAPGDGKSTIARYVAATAAASGVRVILVEADVRRPVLQQLYNLDGAGLTDILTDRASVAEATQHLPIERAVPDVHERVLDVITAGPLPPNPADLLESTRMQEVLHDLEGRYDLVVVDSSPVTLVPDAVPLMVLVTAVVIVVREGKSTRPAVRQLHKQLDNFRISPLGIVVNGADPLSGGYYGGYAYSYAAKSINHNVPPPTPNSGINRPRRDTALTSSDDR